MNLRMKFVTAIVFLVSLAGITRSSWQLAVTATTAATKAQESLISGDEPRFVTQPLTEELRLVHASWEKAAAIAASIPEVEHQLGRATLVLSLAEPSGNKKIELFCRSLRHFQNAALKSPHNPRYQIAWADIASQMRIADVCERELGSAQLRSPLDAKQRLAWAQELAPYSVVDLYLGALVYLGMGEKDKGLELLRLNQEINPHFTKAQRDYTYRLITSEDELNTALPRRYPEIVSWIWHFSTNREHDYLAWRLTFARALDEAITEVKERFAAGKIPSETYALFIKNINSLPLVAASQPLRQRLDEILANIYEVEDNQWWAAVLREREGLIRLPLLKSLIADDKFPDKTMLFGWVPDEEPRRTELDVLGHSLGLYVPRGQVPRLLVLQSMSASARLKENEIEILWSGDNLNYHPLSAKKIETDIVDGRETIVIRFDRADFRYLKIRYLGSSRTSRFINRFCDLVQVYGEVL